MKIKGQYDQYILYYIRTLVVFSTPIKFFIEKEKNFKNVIFSAVPSGALRCLLGDLRGVQYLLQNG